MLHIKTIKSHINKEDTIKLIKAIKNTNKISAYSKSEWLNCKNIYLAYNQKGDLLGACLNDDFSKDWTEIAVIYVFEEYRGMGVGKALFMASLDDGIKRKRNLMVMSNNPKTITMMKHSNLEIYKSLKKLPEKYKKHNFVLNFWYELRWLCNFYRITEIIRKRIVYGKKKKMLYALRLNS
jgi:GNAT superfamily N-acetyltransferase